MKGPGRATIAALALSILVLPTAVSGAPRTPPHSILDDSALAPVLQHGLDLLYDLDLAGAAREFERIRAGRPDHPIGPLLQAEILWWRTQLDPLQTVHDGAMLARIETAIDLAETRLKRNRKDVDGHYALATAYALRGRIRSLRRDWITAGWDGKRALKHVRELHEIRPRDPDLNLGIGLYDYLAAVAPEKYPVLEILRPFFPAGDRERGLALLERARDEGRISRTEAAFFLLQIEYFFEVRYLPAREQVRWLRQRHPGNSVFHLYEGRVYSRWKQCAPAQRVFRDVLAKRAARTRGYGDHQAEVAHFHLARCAMLEGRLDQALEHVDSLQRLAYSRGSTYRSSAHLRRGMIYDLQGKRAPARDQYRRALELPDMGTTHQRAKEYLKEPYRGGGEEGAEES